MNDLIEAFTIFKKYVKDDDYEAKWPTNCDHDILNVSVDPDVVTVTDRRRLKQLSFNVDEDHFSSYRFGSN